MADRRRRVLVVNHFAAPKGHPGGTRHVELFSKLSEWDHLIIASDLNPHSGQRVHDEPGFTVVPVPQYAANDSRRVLNWLAFAWRSVFVGLKQREVDVVYGSSPHLLSALAAWVIAAIKRAPFVLEVRDIWPQVLVDMGQLRATSPVYRVLSMLEGFLYQRATMIVVMAEGSRGILLARGVAASKIRLIPNGADPQDYLPSADREELREQFGFTRPTAVYVGAHGPANGLELLLDAASEVAELPLEIVLVGGGVCKQRLIDEAERRSLTNIRFHDPISKESVPDVLAAADVGLHVLADVELFRAAVSPNKVFDYMASGLPVITNCPGVVGDLVDESRCGVVVAPQRLGSGLHAWYDGRTDPPWDEAGARGKKWLSDNQSRTALAETLGHLLDQVARSSHKDSGRKCAS